jgi:hypothetical protein
MTSPASTAGWSIATRVDFARVRAEVRERVAAAELRGTLVIGLVAVAILVGGLSLFDPLAALPPLGRWTPVIMGLAVWVVMAVGMVGAVRLARRYSARVRARLVPRCHHCGVWLLGPNIGSVFRLGPADDPRSDHVWATGQCPDCRGRLFEVPPPKERGRR